MVSREEALMELVIKHSIDILIGFLVRFLLEASHTDGPTDP